LPICLALTGRLKNSAFAEGVAGGLQNLTFDVAWTLEARTDAEMPEILGGGATIYRPNIAAVPRIRRAGVGGRFVLGPSEDGSTSGAVGSATSSQAAVTTRPEAVPRVLMAFIAARDSGDVQSAAACCTEEVECVGPLGQTVGLHAARTQIFTKPSHAPNARVVAELRRADFARGGKYSLWTRELEIDRRFRWGGGTPLRLTQRFTLSHAYRDGPRVARVEVSRNTGAGQH
jgi:hypothetical protein